MILSRVLLVVIALIAAYVASRRPSDILSMVAWAFSLAASGDFRTSSSFPNTNRFLVPSKKELTIFCLSLSISFSPFFQGTSLVSFLVCGGRGTTALEQLLVRQSASSSVYSTCSAPSMAVCRTGSQSDHTTAFLPPPLRSSASPSGWPSCLWSPS